MAREPVGKPGSGSPGQGYEHFATRSGVAVYDMTPFTKLDVSGPGALKYLQFLSANDVDQAVGKVVYTAMLNSKGGIMCDTYNYKTGRG